MFVTINFEAPFIDAHGISDEMNFSTTIATELSILSQNPSALSDFKLLSLYNFASGKDWKQTVGYLTDIEGEDKRNFITAVGVSPQNARGLLLVYTRSFARFYSHLELQKRANRRGISLNLFIEICKHPERYRDLPPSQSVTKHALQDPVYEDMFVDTIVDSDVSTPESNTASTSDTLFGTDMNERCERAFSPPSNFSASAEPSSDRHSFDDSMYGMDRMVVPDYSMIKDREILFQALTKLYPSFKRRSRLRILRDFIGNLDAWFVKLHTRKTEIIELLELLDRRSRPRGCRGGAHNKTKSTQHKQTLSKSKRLAIRKKRAAQQKLFKKQL